MITWDKVADACHPRSLVNCKTSNYDNKENFKTIHPYHMEPLPLWIRLKNAVIFVCFQLYFRLDVFKILDMNILFMFVFLGFIFAFFHDINFVIVIVIFILLISHKSYELLLVIPIIITTFTLYHWILNERILSKSDCDLWFFIFFAFLLKTKRTAIGITMDSRCQWFFRRSIISVAATTLKLWLSQDIIFDRTH